MTRASPARVKKRTGPLAIELSSPEAHPVMLAHQFNAEMRKFELVVVVGNFDTAAAALAYADQMLDSGLLKNAQRLS